MQYEQRKTPQRKSRHSKSSQVVFQRKKNRCFGLTDAMQSLARVMRNGGVPGILHQPARRLAHLGEEAPAGVLEKLMSVHRSPGLPPFDEEKAGW